MSNIMSMLQERENLQKAERNMEKVRQANYALVEGMLKRFALKMPDELHQLVEKINVRCGKAVALLSKELANKSGDPQTIGDYTIKVGTAKSDLDNKTSFPLLFVSSPELEKGVLAERQRHEEKEKAAKEASLREEWVNKRVGWLRRRGVEPSEGFRQFVMTLPPMKTSFDGSRERVARIAELRCGIQWFGKKEDGIFAVAFENDEGGTEVTIFVQDLDCKQEFANKLVERLGITPKLAKRISDSLPHDRWYGIYDKVRTKEDVLDYARQIARRLRVKEGEQVHDLLQGDLDVIVFNTKSDDDRDVHLTYLDVNPAEPSAVLVGNVLNVYLPN